MDEKDYFHKLFWKFADNLLGFLAGLVVCGLISLGMYKCAPLRDDVQRDTVTVVKTVTDTFFQDRPVPVKEELVRYVYARVPKKGVEPDTLPLEASTEPLPTEGVVTIPITQKEYVDSTYRAWVSGYMANLDSIEVYRRNVYTTRTITVQKKAPRLSVGLTGGYFVTPKGLQPGLGVGLTWRLVPP